MAEWGPDGAEDSLAKDARAQACTSTIPLIAGAGLTAAVAYRWKTPAQRERQDAARSPHELPELDHNEIVGWSGAAGGRRASPPSSSTTATCIRARASASS